MRVDDMVPGPAGEVGDHSDHPQSVAILAQAQHPPGSRPATARGLRSGRGSRGDDAFMALWLLLEVAAGLVEGMRTLHRYWRRRLLASSVFLAAIAAISHARQWQAEASLPQATLSEPPEG